jgi:uncharacterized protein (TIGR04255 family)
MISIGPSHSRVLGMFREAVKGEFPNTEYQSRLPKTFIVNTPAPLPGNFPPVFPQFVTQEGSNRVWLVSADNSRLVQIQDDRFVFNWRRGTEPYPQFEKVAELFWQYFDLYREIVAECDSAVEPQMLELSYFNWLDEGSISQGDAILSSQYSRINWEHDELRFEGQVAATNYSIINGGVTTGRLQVQSANQIARVSRSTSTLEKGAILNLSYFYALPPGADDPTIDDQIFSGRSLIVNAFDQLTTEAAHTAWERQ